MLIIVWVVDKYKKIYFNQNISLKSVIIDKLKLFAIWWGTKFWISKEQGKGNPEKGIEINFKLTLLW
jgi:hypothetical protein